MQRSKRWNISQPHPEAAELASQLRISPVVAQILINRGITEPQKCQEFLRPSLKLLHEPSLIHDLTKASERIARAIRDHEKIVIYGDYDVDGITATSILWHAIRVLGGDAVTYIPHRIDEGYGLNDEAIGQLITDGAKLIISVDCGVTAASCANVALERGVDLIISDHHEWHEENGRPCLPQAYAIVHPRLATPEMTYPNPHLCGAGVAFKLAWGIGKAVNGAAKVSDTFKAFLLEATALAALGTIADVVPLVGENRVLAAFGLNALPNSKLSGIAALLDSAGLTGKDVDAYHVGFLLAPRLNACGRMGHARQAVEMLTTASPEKAKEIADYLEKQNRERQSTEKQILAQALEQIERNGQDHDDCRAIVLGQEGWHPGVIGIVASRIVDRLHRPTIMVALNNGHGSGSGRSIAGFHLARALEACHDLLLAHGGHEMAAGVKLKSENFSAFRERFCEYANNNLDPELLRPELKLEAEAKLNMITEPLVHEMQRLGPFGHANRKPLLACRNLTLAAEPRRVGKTGDHLQLYLRQDGVHMKGIAFNHGAMFDQLKAGGIVDLAVEPCLNEFNGRTSVELQVKDVVVRGGKEE
jgi:single-stranded-DNA-specific exonuclease